jgi:esterase/lipase
MKLVGTLALFSILTFAFTYNLDFKIQKQSDQLVQSPLADTTIVFKRGNRLSVNVHYKEFKDTFGLNIGTIVLLPGWNYSSLDWCNKTDLCKLAEEWGYSVILVDMSKSIYSSQNYPQTRADMKKYATRTWFKDTLVPFFQKEYGVLLEGGNNYVLGLSTGGRGSALLCLDLPEVFKKGASLSGDYNQASMPTDNLMNIFYGPYNKHKDRWIGQDNVVYNLDRFKVPFYIGHGLKDNVVPFKQSLEFYDSLKVHQPDLNVVFHVDSIAKHDYKYWGSEVKNVIRFFLD